MNLLAAFLNRNVYDEIYTEETDEGVDLKIANETCRLLNGLSGLKITSQRWCSKIYQFCTKNTQSNSYSI